MINSIINVDLHIHSKSSEYKDHENVVNGTTDNLPILFAKLEQYKVGLFAITDHNRFDPDMYWKAKEICESGEYPSVKNNLAGVEFDVQLEKEMDACHIVTLFNVKSKDDTKKLFDEISKNELKKDDDYYTRNEYERLLACIDLDSLLIVHQRCTLNRSKKTERSLSGSTTNPYEAVQVGYINALEYQSPHVEGILKDNLKDLDSRFTLLTGSDCHQWEYYPDHDQAQPKNEDWRHTRMKCLPSFKGVLLALTSPETRINPIEKEGNSDYLSSFMLDDQQFDLDTGINVIVGENGSGKSTLLDLLYDKKNLKPHEKSISKKSKFECEHLVDKSRTLRVEQAAIVNKFNDNELFPDSYYDSVDNQPFETAYKNFSAKLKHAIKVNINKYNVLSSLNTKNFTFDEKKEKDTYFIQCINDLADAEENVELGNHRKSLNSILKSLLLEIDSGFYKGRDLDNLKSAFKKIKSVYSNLLVKYYADKADVQVKNLIIKEVKSYEDEFGRLSTSHDSSIRQYQQDKENIIGSIVEALRINNLKNDFPDFPEIINSGKTEKRKNGFVFSKATSYNGNDVSNDFLKRMFNKDYHSIDALKNIKTNEKFSDAIYQCNDVTKIEDQWEKNCNKFIEMQEGEAKDIIEDGPNIPQGQTLGELSLTYYKYHLNDPIGPKTLVFIDQPEDNISNNHISGELIRYFNKMRKSKQLFIVTHNPLLVINLDADNVIITQVKNGKLTCKSGCLEDDENGILDYVANNMDGGKESLRKRFKLYE